MDLLFFDVKSNVGNAFQHRFAHGLLDFEMVSSRKREEKVLVKRNGQVTHAAAALANPTAFGRGEGAFYGIVGAVAVGHCCMQEDKEIAVAVVLKVAQPDAELVWADGVVDVDIKSHAVLLPPFGFRDDSAFVE